MTDVQKIALGSVFAAVVLLAAYWTLLFFAQRSILFPAPPVTGAPPRPPFAEQVWLKTPIGRVEAWYLEALGATSASSPLLLFTHGNGELIDYWPEEFDEARRSGIAVLLVEYPGYGRSDGSPSEASITDVVLAAYAWAQQHPRIDKSRIIPYGRSLGGGAATIVATRRNVPALILESSFSSVAAFTSRFGAPRFLLRDAFDNAAAVAAFSGPILILHGERDDIVPPDHARVLAAAAADATLKYLPCGHNDCRRPWREILDFLTAHGLI